MIDDTLAAKMIKTFGEAWAVRDDTGYVLPFNVRYWRDSDDMLAYVTMGNVGMTSQTGHTSTVDESNFRSLIRDHPDMFTPVSYTGSERLGAFLADLDDDAAQHCIHLATGGSIHDEDDLFALEDEQIEASWEQFARQDLFGSMDEHAQNEWRAIGNDRVEQLTWSLVHAAKEGRVPSIGYGSGEECVRHTGMEVSWDYERMTAPLASAISHTAHKLRKRGLIA